MNTYKEIINKIGEYNTVTIFGHKLPDGDCYGSAIGLKHLILDLYPEKKVYVLGSGLPLFYNLIGSMDVIENDIITNSLAILVDATDIGRSEDARISSALEIIKIDHHIENEKFEGIHYVDTKMSSTCELLLDMAHTLELKISPLAANALFLGMVTDTGRFMFCSNGEQLHKAIAQLYKIGIDDKEIFKRIALTDIKSYKFKNFLSTQAVFVTDNIVYCLISNEMIKKYDVTFAYASSLVNTLSGIENIKVWCLFTEREDGSYRCEFRSEGDINVQQIAVKYGGGGHHNASGIFNFTEGVSGIEKIIDCIKLLLENRG